MIRDPSDGSVREAKDGLTCKGCGEAFFPDASQEREPTTGFCWLCFHNATKPDSKPDTGLRQPTSTDAQMRLERSREWLKNYHERNSANADGGSSEQEFQASGHSIEGEREAESGASDLVGPDSRAHRQG